MNGIFIIQKPEGLTSFSVVSRIKKFTGEKKVGHAGTLDPMATGVLPVLVGRCTSLQEALSDHDKEYVAGVRLGLSTDSGDITGKVLETLPVNVTREQFEEVLQTFKGEQKQVPPMYSAVWVEGVRLYELARRGIEIERKAREIEIYDISLEKQESDTDFVIRVSCSKGTYIRTLCEDIGKKLGVPACMYSLERSVCGIYTKDMCVNLSDIEACYKNGDVQGLKKLLISAESLYAHLKKVRLPEFYTKLCKNGCEIYLKKARIKEETFSDGACAIYGFDGEFLGPGVLKDYPDGKAIKLEHYLF